MFLDDEIRFVVLVWKFFFFFFLLVKKVKLKVFMIKLKKIEDDLKILALRRHD